MASRTLKFNAFRRSTIFLVVVFALLASISGCLGVFEESGEKSPEEVREEFMGMFGGSDASYSFTVNVSDGSDDDVEYMVFDGHVGKTNGYLMSSGDLIERNSTEVGDRRTYYATVLRDGRLNLTVGEETVSIEDVDRNDLGTTYDVNMTNRSRWSFVTPDEELKKVLRSDVYDEKERVDISITSYRESVDTVDATRLKADRDVVAELLNKQYESPMGKRALNLSGEDIEMAQVHLIERDLDLSSLPPAIIQIKVETEDGRKILSTILR